LGLAAGGCLAAEKASAATADPAAANADPYANETPAQRDARMKWWREARFGMFIHWGVYSVPAGFYKDKPVAGIGEWIMNRGKIPVAEYQAFAKQFNPMKFNADQWVSIAKEAGMKYMVITSKHHDGFAMFHSQASKWNIFDATPFGRDPLAELAAACKKQGMKLGFYYSQAQDWNNPGGAANGGHWDPAQEGDMDQYIAKVAVPQIREILSNYGPVSVLWFDTATNMTAPRAEAILPLLKLQPGIIYNNRLGGGYHGDTETPEQHIPPTGYPGRDWETCMTMNGTWGYKKDDDNWKSVDTLLHNLCDIASKGGNYLLNVGPTSEGLIPGPSVERLQEVGKWMKQNGEAIYGTTASPFKRLPWGRATTKLHEGGATLYLHVFDWPSDGKLTVPGLKNPATKAWLLVEPGKSLPLEAHGSDLMISVPLAAPDKIVSVIALEITGTPDIEQMLLSQAADGSLDLVPSDAILHGQQLKVEESRHKQNLGYWLNPADYAEWKFVVTQPGTFNLSAEASAQGNSSLQLAVGDRRLEVQIPTTGDYKTYKKVTLGKIELAAGKNSLTVKAAQQGWHPVNLRSITVKPAK
jgi:alpha-L-fucosidase